MIPIKHSLRQHAAREHGHMLGCSQAWFRERYPDEWERVRKLPTEEGLEAIRAFYKIEENAKESDA